MQLSDFIIGMMAFVATTMVCLSLMNTMYNVSNPHSYQVNLSNDKYTAQLSTINDKLIVYESKNYNISKSIYNQQVGEPNGTLDVTASQTSSWSSASLALGNIGSYIAAAKGLLLSFASVLGLSETSAFMVFIIGSIIIIIAFIIIGIVFFRPL